MKRIAILIPTLAAAFLINATPSISGEMGTMGNTANVTAQKDQCLLVAAACPDNVDSIQQRISKLQAEIRKGTDVYTNDELKRLNDKLTDEFSNYRILTEHN